MPDDPPDSSSTKLLADDPGLFADAGVFPAENYVVRMNFHNNVRSFDGTQWIDLPAGLQMRIFDLTTVDDTNGPMEDLELTLTGSTQGLVGSINVDVTESAVAPISASGIHGHIGYELSAPNADDLAQGAYMVELTISANGAPYRHGTVACGFEPDLRAL